MTVTTVRTADLPRDVRFGYWRELADRSHVPTILETDHRGDWDATMQIHDLGSLGVSIQEHPQCVARRTARLIRQSDPGHLYLIFPTRGRMVAHQRERVADHGAESFVVLDTSVPVTVTSPTPTRHVIAHIPRWLLPAKLRFEHLLATPVAARRGLGGALIHVLRELARSDHGLPALVLTQLTQTVIDLFVAVQAVTDGNPARMPTESRERAKLIQAYAYVERRLSDPSLTLVQVARAHGLSVRQLGRLFQRDGTTPAAWIRDERLRRCRRDLADPAQRATPVSAIGARWGYGDPVTFSRAFSRVYGMPPGEYRRQFARPTDGS